jgi:hypothetical protein
MENIAQKDFLGFKFYVSCQHAPINLRFKKVQKLAVSNAFPVQITIYFLFCTFNTLSITLKWASKRSSFRYRFQELLLKFLMLAVTHSECGC